MSDERPNPSLSPDPEAAARLLTLVRASARVVLTGPEGPDGDSIGACLALRRILRTLAPGVVVDVVGVAGSRYAFLPDVAEMLANSEAQGADGVVVLDGDCRRLPAPVLSAFSAARWTGLVDHHHSTDAAGYAVALLAPKAESTCGMVAALAGLWGVPLDADLASLVYAGLVFDTGAFRYSNTQPSTHRLAANLLETGIDHSAIVLRTLVERRAASLRLMGVIFSSARFGAAGRTLVGTVDRETLRALGARETDLDGVVDVLQHVENVEVAALIAERPGGAKVSLRSRGRLNVAAIAQQLHASGGGHAKAAGVVMAADSFADAVERVAGLLERETSIGA